MRARNVSADQIADGPIDESVTPHATIGVCAGQTVRYYEKQKHKFAGIAKKKGKLGNLLSKSLVPNREISITGSDEEEQGEQCNNVMVLVEPKRAPDKYRTMSAKAIFYDTIRSCIHQ